MAKHHIVVDPFDSASIDAAQREIERIQREFQQKVSLLLKALADIAQQTANGAFGGTIVVTTEPITNGYKVSANGTAVVFLEFGAGATTEFDLYAEKMPFAVERGSWSREPSLHSNNQPGEYYQTGYDHWTFCGVTYTQVMPRHGMQKAYNEVITQIRNKVEEIFK